MKTNFLIVIWLAILVSFAHAASDIPAFTPNIVDPHAYLTEPEKDEVNRLIQDVREVVSMDYDYIIVGAGSAGCVLAFLMADSKLSDIKGPEDLASKGIGLAIIHSLRFIDAPGTGAPR